MYDTTCKKVKVVHLLIQNNMRHGDCIVVHFSIETKFIANDFRIEKIFPSFSNKY